MNHRVEFGFPPLKPCRLLLSLGFAVLAASCNARANDHGGKPASQAGSASILRMQLIGAVSASLEPCDCQPNMAGGLDHAAAALHAVADRQAAAPPALLLVAGSMLFETPALAERKRGQALLKARVIAASFADMRLAVWTPGLSDLAAGVATFDELAGLTRAPAVAANLELDGSGAVHRSRIVERAGLRIGVTGVLLAGAGVQLPLGVRVVEPLVAAKRALAELRKQKADFSVLLVSGPRDAALRLLGDLRGFELAVVGADDPDALASDSEAPSSDARVGQTLVVAPASRLQTVALVDVARRAGRLRLEQKAALQVTDALGTDARIAGRMQRHYAEVEALNRSIEDAPVTASPGKATYVGAQRCGECHDSALVFWNNTAHARAYWTLLDASKAHNLDCVGCHVTGYDQPGGSAGTQVKGLEAVQCEACHGPGSKHARSGAPESILRTPERELCRTCHHPPHVERSWKLEPAWQKTIGPGHGQRRDR